jgi:hypothetical protein
MLNHGLHIDAIKTNIGKDFPRLGFCSTHSSSLH